jgi:hypothetical protein
MEAIDVKITPELQEKIKNAPWGGWIYIKFILDGVQTLADAAAVLNGVASEFADLHEAGWSILEPFDGGQANLVDPTGFSNWHIQDMDDED